MRCTGQIGESCLPGEFSDRLRVFKSAVARGLVSV
jgi:hypothetical protein